MSRLGDMIKKQRSDRALTPKQAAKLCGVAESYLLDVEAGKRIIADESAIKMLKKLGLAQVDEVSQEAMKLDVQKEEEALNKPKQAVKKTSDEKPKEASDAWMDALGGVLKRVPVINNKNQTIEHKLLPTVGGMIEGAPADKVLYVKCGDNDMSGYRIFEGDIVFVNPIASLSDKARICAFEQNGQIHIRKLSRQDGNLVKVSAKSSVEQTQIIALSEIKLLGVCVKVEFWLE